MPRARSDPRNVPFDELLRGDGLARASHNVRAIRASEAEAALSRSHDPATRTPDERWEPRALLSEPLLSAAEAGALLGIPRSSVYDYAKRGELPHVRVGKHVKFIRQDLERALAERRVGM
jgi:excisionase family DNA binding protein